MTNSLRISIGEFEHPERPGSTDLARIRFVNAVFRVAPNLHKEFVELQSYQPPANDSQRKAWAIGHHLPDDWFLEIASVIFGHSPSDEASAEGPAINSRDDLILCGSEGKQLTLTFPLWDPVLTPRPYYEKKMVASFKEHLKHFCDQTEASVKVRGLIRTHNRKKEEHFHWLAGYQVRGWSMTRIADAYGVARSTVEEAVTHLAKLLGLPLRAADLYDDKQTKDIIADTLKSLIRNPVR